MPVCELLARVSSKELTDWMLFENLEPFGAPIQSYRFGTIAALIANMFGKKSYTPADFMWDLSEERKAHIATTPRQTVEEMKQVMLSFIKNKKGKKDGN